MSAFATIEKTPLRLEINELVESRYAHGERPLSWDERAAGIDIVRTTEGRCIKLFSDGGQSPPKKGWVIMITGGSAEQGYHWTLYGLPPRAVI